MRRPPILLAVAIVAFAALGPACADDGGGGGGGPDPVVSPSPDPTPLLGSVTEVEPNDTRPQATAVSSGDGAFEFHGRCEETSSQDWFAFALTPQSYLVSLAWDERRYLDDHIANDLDLFVHDSSGELARNDDIAVNGGPVDSPAEVVAMVGSAWTVHVLVDCYQADEDLFYQGTLEPGS